MNLYIAALALLSCCVSFVRSTAVEKPPVLHINRTFLNPLPLPLQHMVVDRAYSGRIYVGAVNRLYQFNSGLDLQAYYETGPAMDSPNCPAFNSCYVRKHEMNNYNKALAIYQKQTKLIACGSLFQGGCQLHNLYNISISDPRTSELVVANDDHSSTVAFVAPGPPDPATTDVFYVASTFTDLGPYSDDVPAVASLSLQPNNMFKVAHRYLFHVCF
ncbi:unnamed protein product [Soboliphyme baturini]|uniref:Sema domain-containing protein n=1 Tax=Soboliphyme baturini TaxID=241478 RepID=A0A183J8J5_9BILA|nr:unnamed protein product [Soboliphyme baturini]